MGPFEHRHWSLPPQAFGSRSSLRRLKKLRPAGAAVCLVVCGALSQLTGLAWSAPGHRQTNRASATSTDAEPARSQDIHSVHSRRSGLLGAVAASLLPTTARAVPEQEVDLYFGCGNFNHLQHVMAFKEADVLKRRANDITSVSGFAGGIDSGNIDRVCWRNILGAPNYAQLGHSQAVFVSVPEKSVVEFANTFFDDFANRRKDDDGAERRPLLGLRYGLKSKLYPAVLEAATAKNITLVKGKGNDKDIADSERTIYVYDSKRFPFRPAETYNQFRNDGSTEKYDYDYLSMGQLQLASGLISSNGCP
eukprot:TRINITY_DN90277_c0_g1_i1.p1 TRINITY_DN90277_c0_g1~~TRINITY_DN90277_c0_g1_i1.p1  ORF type:complete len:307 (-),score=53.42 TRINITY_DN90277_c0_g1_i1:138-1058(-)